MDASTLEAIKGDIQYEVNMALFTANLIGKLNEHILKTTDESNLNYFRTLNNTALESHLLHIRSLRDFFCTLSGSRINDDAIAEDYVEKPDQWQKNRYKMTYIEDLETRMKLNKLLAHLSYQRAKIAAKGKPDWDVSKTKEEISEAWKAFYDCLPANRTSWFTVPEQPPIDLLKQR